MAQKVDGIYSDPHLGIGLKFKILKNVTLQFENMPDFCCDVIRRVARIWKRGGGLF